jgi:two-component system NtrC family response regulator
MRASAALASGGTVRGSILVVDDEARICSFLVRALEAEGLNAQSALNPEEGLERLKGHPFDIVITDLRMPGIDGLELLRRAKVIRPQCEVVLMTGYASVETAREALKRGAVDYITKPFDVDKELLPVIFDVLHAAEGEDDEPLPGAPPNEDDGPVSGCVGSSDVIRSIVDKVRKVARSHAPVLLRGESGTGKEIFANLIHRFSPRCDRPMVRLNCAALPETLMESELFGYARGSFTGASHDRVGLFQAANLGTMFLDEVGEVSSTMQPKLLRVLQDGEFHRIGDPHHAVSVDVRIIAATNRNIEEAVENGSFRRDLYYRLNVVPIEVPPLRDHIEDLPELIDHFFRKIGNPANVRLSEEALETMQRYSWPGNIRELANAIEYALVLGEPPEIGVEDLPVAIQDYERKRHQRVPAEDGNGSTLEDIEMRCILQAMARTGYNRTRAAHLLGITRRTLGYRIQKYDLAERLDREQTESEADDPDATRRVGLKPPFPSNADA